MNSNKSNANPIAHDTKPLTVISSLSGQQNSGARAPATTEPSTDQGASGLRPARIEEIGGPQGLEPTRYGDWERKGRCVDF